MKLSDLVDIYKSWRYYYQYAKTQSQKTRSIKRASKAARRASS